ncbi:hypothetical protein N7489_001770 [Penicillium chrysogenum]|uniref:Uncharacterized protein n=1 Tax=Penicillium chrysogenum TaxID=5076 RepID=A0ABQ8WJR0_PENCH|nr:uncharacterized protein N7489_001770 [Penicillium chrysogenum]KAJ5251360.1 hypothetical protein N7489_001770 [Penicillium chrysogenum]KAJ5262793.1 hypothetical protein N7524_008098 [Penicillium chrysogenum]KAJ5270259.1 hypothetical protein N7505_006017 [Penicillium chrysogenum]KAJ6146996.1 hypothetical protein N7497_008978 [Penicillium chrysogenum]
MFKKKCEAKEPIQLFNRKVHPFWHQHPSLPATNHWPKWEGLNFLKGLYLTFPSSLSFPTSYL